MKNVYCTLDTETFGGAANPKGIYHLAGRVHDRNGAVMATFNYLICEHYDEINKDSYAKRNFHKYLEMVEAGSITMIDSETHAVDMVDALCNFYNVKYIMAFNSCFDLEKTMCSRLVENREFIDIYLMALQTITHRKAYAKFCRDNGFRAKGKTSTSVATGAQALYAYITNNPDYKEEHTALEDSKIEIEIFLACLKTHKKFTKNQHQYDCHENKCFPSWYANGFRG